MKNSGLTEKEWEQIRAVLRAVPAIEKAVLFGSRAMGLARGNSDVDIMLYGEKLTMGDVAHARALLEETTLPYQFDLVLHDVGNETLQEHVHRYGKVISENKWRKITLGELCNSQNGSIQTGPFGSQLHASDYVEHGIPVVMPANIGDFCIVSDGISMIGKDDAKRLSQHAVIEGDVLFSRRGDVTKCVRIKKYETGWLCGTGCLKVRLGNESIALSRYVSHYLRLPSVKEWLVRHAVGATMPNLNTSILSSIQLIFPVSIEKQNQIADFLDALDDRIQLLHETNATLEAMAQALFKSWFVDFDPVHAKAEGRAPEGMDPETAALFPDEFEESELGMIPKGWRVVLFADTVSILSGGTPKTTVEHYWNGNIPWFSVVDAPCLSDVFVMHTEKNITSDGVANSSAKILPTGTTIISARGTVGKLAITGKEMSMNQSCYGLNGVFGDVYFTYFNTLRLVDELKCRSHGSVFDTITRSTFGGVNSIKPQPEIVELFESSITPLMEKIKENLMLSHTLTALRDTLLPRLISGKLRLPEFAEAVDEATV